MSYLVLNFLGYQRDFVRGRSWKLELRSLYPRDLTKNVSQRVWANRALDMHRDLRPPLGLRWQVASFELHSVVTSILGRGRAGNHDVTKDIKNPPNCVCS